MDSADKDGLVDWLTSVALAWARDVFELTERYKASDSDAGSA